MSELQKAVAPPFSPEQVHVHDEGVPLSGNTLISEGSTVGLGRPTVSHKLDVGLACFGTPLAEPHTPGIWLFGVASIVRYGQSVDHKELLS